MTSNCRAATSATLLPVLCLIVSFATPGPLRAATLYDFALGFPGTQGWAETVQTDPPAGWPRPGYGIALSDVNGNFLGIGLGSGEVFPSHTAYGQYNSSNTAHASFNTTDQHHAYRIERGPGGVGAVLRVDGVVLLQLNTPGSPDGSAGPSICFGDLTCRANSESHTRRVRAFTPTLDVDAREGSQVLWAKTVGGATGRPGIAAGDTGRLEPASALRTGLYFDRVRLEPASGRETQAGGKFAVVR